MRFTGWTSFYRSGMVWVRLSKRFMNASAPSAGLKQTSPPCGNGSIKLQTELQQLQFVATCKDALDLGDSLVSLSLVERTGSNRKGIEKLTAMYQALANRRRMSVE